MEACVTVNFMLDFKLYINAVLHLHKFQIYIFGFLINLPCMFLFIFPIVHNFWKKLLRNTCEIGHLLHCGKNKLLLVFKDYPQRNILSFL